MEKEWRNGGLIYEGSLQSGRMKCKKQWRKDSLNGLEERKKESRPGKKECDTGDLKNERRHSEKMVNTA